MIINRELAVLNVKAGAVFRDPTNYVDEDGKQMPKFLVIVNGDYNGEVRFYKTTTDLYFYGNDEDIDKYTLYIPHGTVTRLKKDSLIQCDYRTGKWNRDDFINSYVNEEIEYSGELPPDYRVALKDVVDRSDYVKLEDKKIVELGFSAEGL